MAKIYFYFLCTHFSCIPRFCFVFRFVFDSFSILVNLPFAFRGKFVLLNYQQRRQQQQRQQQQQQGVPKFHLSHTHRRTDRQAHTQTQRQAHIFEATGCLFVYPRVILKAARVAAEEGIKKKAGEEQQNKDKQRGRKRGIGRGSGSGREGVEAGVAACQGSCLMSKKLSAPCFFFMTPLSAFASLFL